MSSKLNITDILTADRVACKITLDNKNQVLQTIAELAATAFPQGATFQTIILEQLIARESLGSTSVGHGVAIPHARCTGTDKIVGVLITLDSPVDFSIQEPDLVTIIFGLIVPENSTEEHLYILQLLAKMMGDKDFRQRLRNCKNNKALYKKVINYHE